MQTIEIENG